jgi:hypothetical protein
MVCLQICLQFGGPDLLAFYNGWLAPYVCALGVCRLRGFPTNG